MEDYKARFANPYTAAERGYIDDVIVPARDAPEADRGAAHAAEQARTGPEAQARQHPAVSATPEEAAAIVAALERFMRATAPAAPRPAVEPADRWRRAALVEGVSRDRRQDVPDPWINT